MKQRRKEKQVERRRPLVEPNLVGETKSGSSVAPKGLLALLRRLLGGQR
jgi:hypothetical protein